MTGTRFAILAGAMILGTTLTSGAALADPGHGRDRDRAQERAGPGRYYPGPGNSRIPYQTGYYTDNQHQRRTYTYPQDWRRYGRPQSWYQGHSHWNEPAHQDWYRGSGNH